MSKHKVKQNFTHKGKQYKPGEDFETNDPQEAQTLAQQGHIEHPQGQQAQSGSGAQQGGSQPGGSSGQKTQGAGAEDDPKQGR